MIEIAFRLSDFEGPLDLLLHLIAKHKLDILDIEISELLRQYVDFIENRADADLEISSSFLEMAARLVHMKSVMLLPRHEEEAERLKTQLTGELMEYQLCKLAAQQLGEMAARHRRYVRKPLKMEMDMTYEGTHPASVLQMAIQSSTGRVQRQRPVEPQAFSGIVHHRVVSVGSRIIHLLRRLYRSPESRFDSLFYDQRDRSELVATFLALLELIKGGRVTVSEDGQTVRFHREVREKGERIDAKAT